MSSENGDHPPFDPNADYGELWAAIHDYLVVTAQDDPNAADISRAYGRLVDAHNMIHERYVSEAPPTIKGV